VKSALAIDADIIKEFNITEDIDVPTDVKLAFVQAQIQEIKSMMWRERVNVMHATRLSEEKNEALSAKGKNNIVEHRTAVRQSVGALKQLLTLQKELEGQLEAK
jgi:hypothetical protein